MRQDSFEGGPALCKSSAYTRQHKHVNKAEPSMPGAEFKPTISKSEQSKTACTFRRAAAVTCFCVFSFSHFWEMYFTPLYEADKSQITVFVYLAK